PSWSVRSAFDMESVRPSASRCQPGALRGRPRDQQTPRVTHPLDPLSADEFRHAAALLSREKGVARPQWRIAGIMLREPAKDVVRAHRSGDAVERVARAVVWSTSTGTAHIAELDLTADA